MRKTPTVRTLCESHAYKRNHTAELTITADRHQVLHVSQPTIGGVAQCVVNLARFQAKSGLNVAVASPPTGELPDLLAMEGISHFAWPAVREIAPSTVIRELSSLRQIVSLADPEVLHLHSSKAGLVGRLLTRGARPTIYQPHGWSFLAVQGSLRRAVALWERVGTRWADVTLCVSNGEREIGASFGVKGSTEVIPNGTRIEEPTDRCAARSTLCLPDRPTVVCVGRLDPAKGQDLLLEIWSSVVKEVPTAQLYLVGVSHIDTSAFGLSSLRIPKGVTLVPWTKDVRSWLAAADVVAAPSRWEGMSLAVLEALACSRSVIAFDIPGMHELLAGEPAAGMLINPGDLDAFAAALIARLRIPNLADSEGVEGRRRAVQQYDENLTMARLDSLRLAIVGV